MSQPRVWTIGDLNRRARHAVVREFRGPVWVAGELTRLDQRRNSRWLELVERGGGREGRDAHLRAFCSARRWARIMETLGAADVGIRVGQRLVVVGSLEMGDRGELSLALEYVDVAALVGARVLARRQLLQRLADEGLIDANRRLKLADLPLRVGLVASAGSDGHRDLVRPLLTSAFAFEIIPQSVSVEGPQAARLIRAALATFDAREVDVAVVVRGGGATATLDVFDTEEVAYAVATAAVPVWTGIGHAGDRTVADEVAHRCCATPTAVGQALVETVGEAWETVARAGARIGQLAEAVLARAASDVDRRQRDVTTLVRSHLTVHEQGQARTAAELRRAASRGLEGRRHALVTAAHAIRASGGVELRDAHRCLVGLAGQADGAAGRALAGSGAAVDAARALLGAYAPERQLARGWTLTHTIDGRLVRRAAGLNVGEALVTTFADGTSTSTVTSVATAGDAGTAR